MNKTSLHEEHVKLGAKMIDFGGWHLPVTYTSLAQEHQACRTHCGLFDVSHMGEIEITGKDAAQFVDYLITNQASTLTPGRALYTVMCLENGGIVDDLVVYCRRPEVFFLVVNAANTEKDFSHIQAIGKAFQKAHPKSDFLIENKSNEYTQIALQGRHATKILNPLTKADCMSIPSFGFVESNLFNEIPALIARTGYTGEDGFEIYCPWDSGPRVWQALLESGKELGIQPCGLGARDTLRLEMKYPLYGNELNEATHPLETGLAWVVKFDKPDFVGKKALLQHKEEGMRRGLNGIVMKERGIPRSGYRVFTADGLTEIGEITSGTQSPSLNLAIGVAFLKTGHGKIGTPVTVDIRGRKVAAEVTKTPFYTRPYVAEVSNPS